MELIQNESPGTAGFEGCLALPASLSCAVSFSHRCAAAGQEACAGAAPQDGRCGCRGEGESELGLIAFNNLD